MWLLTYTIHHSRPYPFKSLLWVDKWVTCLTSFHSIITIWMMHYSQGLIQDTSRDLSENIAGVEALRFSFPPPLEDWQNLGTPLHICTLLFLLTLLYIFWAISVGFFIISIWLNLGAASEDCQNMWPDE